MQLEIKEIDMTKLMATKNIYAKFPKIKMLKACCVVAILTFTLDYFFEAAATLSTSPRWYTAFFEIATLYAIIYLVVDYYICKEIRIEQLEQKTKSLQFKVDHLNWQIGLIKDQQKQILKNSMSTPNWRWGSEVVPVSEFLRIQETD